MADPPTPSSARSSPDTGPAEATVEDVTLISRVASADREAFAELYDRYERPAYSLAQRICMDTNMAEDVLQEAFLAVWRQPAKYDPERGAFLPWLLTLVHHRAVDAVRKESTRRRRTDQQDQDQLDGVSSAAPPADQLAIAGLVGTQVRAALRDLPSEQREVLALSYYGGYTQGEVADLVGVPIGTVKSRMFAGVRKLRTQLASSLGTDSASQDDIDGGSR